MAKKFLDYDGLGYLITKIKSMVATKADTGHTHSDATTSASGFMSKSDKSKLNGIAEGANAYSHPTTSGNKHIPAGGSSGQILRWSADGTAAWGADSDTTYSEATTSAAGLMSASDKSKLNGIATGATKVTVDSALSSSSTNPVQNKVINTALAGKAGSDHNHDSTYLKKTGGALTGALEIQASSARVQLESPYANGRYFFTQQFADGSVDFKNSSSGQDFATLRLLPESSDGINFLRAIRQVGGNPENYAILHSGNIGEYAAKADHTHTPANIGAAPAPIISQTDITAGSTALATGQSYHVYE